MEVEPFENPWIKKIRVLTNLLVTSVALNIGLCTTIIYRVYKAKEKPSQAQKEIVLGETNAEVLRRFFALSLDELARELSDASLVEEGYTKRDLALACLVNYHNVDIARAVSGVKLQKRALLFVHHDGGEKFTLEAFPGLSDPHFVMIQNFLAKERWPLTAEGLFYTLQTMEKEYPDSLVASFFATPEFYALYTLFNRGKEKVTARQLLMTLLQGSWEWISEVLEEQKECPDRGFESLRPFLIKYIEGGSPLAAALWAELDSEYLQRKLDDTHLVQIIENFSTKTPFIEGFLKQLLVGVRSDGVRKAAGLKLYQFGEGLSDQENYTHELALKTFLPEEPAREEPKKEAPPEVRKHTVLEGDSLWKIAKKHKVSIDELKKANRLVKDHLRPGQELIIPTASHSTGS